MNQVTKALLLGVSVVLVAHQAATRLSSFFQTKFDDRGVPLFWVGRLPEGIKGQLSARS